MELKWLEDFVSVAKLRNFSHAARARHATQPALSRRVRSLENWYGVSLLDRSTYPVTLTEAGSDFLPLAEQIVADLYRSRREARAKLGKAGPAVRFAMPHSLAVSVFPGWWHKQPQHRELSTTVIAADFDECVEMLLNGACQFLMCYQHEAVPSGLEAHGVHCVRIGDDRLVPVSARDASGHALFDLPTGKQTETPLLAYTKTSFLGRVASVSHARLEAHTNVILRFETALVEALKAEALLGEGIAWLPESMIVPELEAGTLQIIGDESLIATLTISLCRPVVSAADVHDPRGQIWSAAAGGAAIA